MSVAALPMYDFPEVRLETDALWSAIALRLAEDGIAAPAALSRDVPLDDLWTDPALLLAQTCGYPLVTSLRGRVGLVATPRYRADGCDGASYRSAIVVRAGERAAGLGDLRGRRCAVNGPDSNSGMNVLRAAVAKVAGGAGFFSEIVVTGAHAASVRAVAEGLADVAAIDGVTWALLQDIRPAETKGLRVLAWSAATPGLPLITSLHTDAATLGALLRALAHVAADPALADVRAALRIEGFVRLPLEDYDAVLALERRARELGYPVLG